VVAYIQSVMTPARSPELLMESPILCFNGTIFKGLIHSSTHAACAIAQHTYSTHTTACRYVLMRGQKRFRLWAPEYAPRMHTAGKVVRIHPNGRIVYEGQVSQGILNENSFFPDREVPKSPSVLPK